jgi:hypothetical protein
LVDTIPEVLSIFDAYPGRRVEKEGWHTQVQPQNAEKGTATKVVSI